MARSNTRLVPRAGKRLIIGVSLFVRGAGQSLWENGIFQNCLLLILLLRQSPLVADAVMVNGGEQVADPQMMLGEWDVQLLSMDEALERCDVLIEMSEPNICMVKTSIIPMLVTEEAYRANPAFLEFVRVCNTIHMKEHPTFVHFAKSLDIVEHGITTFESRYAVYEFMAAYGDAVVSHTWENAQNYLYYELLYGDYPLIHNSPFLGKAGYFYPDFDCQAGGRALLQAFAGHDANLDAYREQSKHVLDSVSIYNPENVAAYTDAIASLYRDA